MKRTAAAVVLLLALALTACGGGSSNKTASGSSTTTEASSATAGSGGTVNTTFSGQGSSRFCELGRDYDSRFKNFSQNITSPQELRTQITALKDAINQAVDVAPSEIKNDVKVLAKATSDFFTVLEQANYDFTKIPPDAAARFESPEVKAAADRLDAYGKNVCGISG